MGIVYLAQNKLNGKCYIGKTTKTLNRRKAQHLYDAKHRNSYFNNAIQKYGIKSFVWEVIDVCKEEPMLNKLEKFYIFIFNSFENGYNLTKGGEGISGWKHSSDTIQEIVRKNTNKKHSLEVRKKISKSNGGFIIGAQLDRAKNPETRCWQSVMTFSGNKRKSLGYYEDPFTASLVYILVFNILGGIA